jgi:CubicO group peptidase (beta-lactamase class C family)
LSKPGWGAEGTYSTTGDLFRWYTALHDHRILSRKSISEMFSPTVKIKEGMGGLGWFVGRSPRGETQFFVRGNEDWGPNSLLYAYPRAGLIIIVLTHAGDATADLSWSRAVLGKLQAALNL